MDDLYALSMPRGKHMNEYKKDNPQHGRGNMQTRKA